MEAVQYKCPNCGAGLTFKTESQSFECDFCRSVFTDEEVRELYDEDRADNEQKEREKLERKKFSEETAHYICKSCGSEIIADMNTAATFCYYCHGPVVLSDRVLGKYRPTKIIPFATTKDAAVEKYNRWCGKKWFVPNDYKSSATAEKILGIYIPFWLANCSVTGKLNGTAKKVERYSVGNVEHTNIHVFDIQREASAVYKGIPADASRKASDRLMESIEPYDYRGLIDFSMAYLSGYLADKYDVEKTEIFPRIKERVIANTKSEFRNSISGYTSFDESFFDVKISKTDWDYALLPVWFLNYKYKDKYYYFAVNGQTGKVSGLLPFCAGKAAAVSALIGLIAAIITIIVGGFLI